MSSPLPAAAIGHHLLGLLATFIGAGLTDATGSLWPLALGGSASMMCTLRLVMTIWTKRGR